MRVHYGPNGPFPERGRRFGFELSGGVEYHRGDSKEAFMKRKNEPGRGKRYRSILRRIVIVPIAILLPINALTILMSVVSLQDAERQMLQQDVAVLDLTASRIGSALESVDRDLSQFASSGLSYLRLSEAGSDLGQAAVLKESYAVKEWMADAAAKNDAVEGLFFYFPGPGLALFQGPGRQYDIHDYLAAYAALGPTPPAGWRLVDIGSGYIVRIGRYNGSYFGAWVSLTKLDSDWLLDRQNLMPSSFLTNEPNLQADGPGVLYSVVDAGFATAQRFFQGGDRIYRSAAGTTRLSLGFRMSRNEVLSHLPLATRAIFAVTLLAFLASPLLVMLLYNSAGKPLRTIEAAMERIGGGDKRFRIPDQSRSYETEFDRLGRRFNRMLDDLDELDRTLYQAKTREQKIKMKYISQQIRPHFILNALNLLYTYGPDEYERSQRMTMCLSEYFRYVVNLHQDLVELEKEFLHMRNYLAIQQERYPERLSYSVEWESRTKDCLLPPLIVQTFVENSIKYGLKDAGKTDIYVLAREVDDQLLLTVGDTGNGMPEDLLRRVREFLATRVYQDDLGIGIQNAVERLDLQYGERTDIRIENQEEGGIQVEIRLPILRQAPHA